MATHEETDLLGPRRVIWLATSFLVLPTSFRSSDSYVYFDFSSSGNISYMFVFFLLDIGVCTSVDKFVCMSMCFPQQPLVLFLHDGNHAAPSFPS